MKFLNNLKVGNVNYTLPYTDGTNGQVLKTDGSGNVTWATDSAGTDTTYSISSVTTTGGAFLRLTAGGSGSGTDDVKFAGAGIAVVSQASDVITITATETYTAHENITAASSVDNSGNDFIQDITVDSNGHVTGLASGTATFTETYTAHENITAASSVDNSGNDFIQDITLDSNGHVTGLGSATATFTETYTAHENITAASSVDNSGNDFIQDVTLDGNGHVTGLTSGTATFTETYTQHENISAASSVNNSGNDFIQDVTLDSNGHVTGLVTATVSAGTGDLVDVATNASLNVIATYEGTANTIDYAGNGTYNLMSDGSELSLANDIWAERASGGASPKYFFHVSPSGTTRSAMYATGAEVLSIKGNSDDQWIALRNANSVAGNIAGYAMRTDSSEGNLYIEGRKGPSGVKTYAIESISTSATADRLHVINYGDNHFRFSNAISDQPYMFYWGNGTSWGNVTNEFTTLGVRIDPTTIAVDGTNNPTTPNFRFLDDGDTGMYLASTGVTAFASGGSKVFTIPSTAGTNGYILQTDGSGNCSWVANSGGTSYSAGAGLDLTSTTFSLERDLKVDVDVIGSSANDYIEFDAGSGTRTDVFVNGAIVGAFRNDGAPEFHCDGDIIGYSTTISDARLKDDVKTIESASEKVSRLRGVEYTWKKGSRAGHREIGLIAQEVEEVVPEIVHEKSLPLFGGLDDSSSSYKTVDYEKIIALLIESNKEQQDIISQLEERIIALEDRD